MHINVNKVKLEDNLFSMKILLVKYWVMKNMFHLLGKQPPFMEDAAKVLQCSRKVLGALRLQRITRTMLRIERI